MFGKLLRIGSRGLWREVDVVEFINVKGRGVESDASVMVSRAGGGLRATVFGRAPVVVGGSEKSSGSARSIGDGKSSLEYMVYPLETLKVQIKGRGVHFESMDGKKLRTLYLWHK